MLELVLPRLLKLDWCTEALSDALWNGSDEESGVVIRALAPIEYVDPSALALLAAWGARMRERGVVVRIDDSAKSQYGWRVGLLTALAGKFPETVEASDHFVRARLRSELDIERALQHVRPVLHASEDESDAVGYFLSELLRNVFEHAQSREGAFLAGGWFPNRGRVTLAVADLGLTVPVHFQRRLASELPPANALELALEPLVSGSRDRNRNAGPGLYMTRRISTLMGGRFWLYTGNLRVTAAPADEVGLHAAPLIEETALRWPGTAVAVTLYVDGGGTFRQRLQETQRELSIGAGRAVDVFRRKIPPGARVIRIAPDVGSMAQDKVAAAGIRDDQIFPLVRDGDDAIALDLGGVTLTTQSYIHALLAGPLRALGRAGIERRLWIVAADDQPKEVVRIVIGYILNELELESGPRTAPQR